MADPTNVGPVLLIGASTEHAEARLEVRAVIVVTVTCVLP